MIHYKKTLGDHIFDLVIYFFVAFVLIVTLYPLIYVISMSISDPMAAARGEVWLFPVGFNLSALKRVLNNSQVFTYYYNTLWYTVVGTLCGILVTCLGAYPLSRHEFKARRWIMPYIMFTMFFTGGLIADYIVVGQYMDLMNSRLAIILPALTSAWYITVARNYFESLPSDIIESARIDGASEYRIFGQLVMPLSKPIIGVLGMYFAVGHWNSYFPAMLYLGKKEMQPLALYVRDVVIRSSMQSLQEGGEVAVQSVTEILSALQLKYAVVVVAVLPMLLIYPFLSKNLEKGLMIGAVKG